MTGSTVSLNCSCRLGSLARRHATNITIIITINLGWPSQHQHHHKPHQHHHYDHWSCHPSQQCISSPSQYSASFCLASITEMHSTNMAYSCPHVHSNVTVKTSPLTVHDVDWLMSPRLCQWKSADCKYCHILCRPIPFGHYWHESLQTPTPNKTKCYLQSANLSLDDTSQLRVRCLTRSVCWAPITRYSLIINTQKPTKWTDTRMV